MTPKQLYVVQSNLNISFYQFLQYIFRVPGKYVVYAFQNGQMWKGYVGIWAPTITSQPQRLHLSKIIPAT